MQKRILTVIVGSILVAIALIATPVAEAAFCGFVCTCTSRCSTNCVAGGPPPVPTTCGGYGVCAEDPSCLESSILASTATIEGTSTDDPVQGDTGDGTLEGETVSDDAEGGTDADDRDAESASDCP